MSYYLFNHDTQERLEHPQYGLWVAPTIQDAQEMVRLVKAYLEALGAPGLCAGIVIVDQVTGEEIVGSDSLNGDESHIPNRQES